MARRTPEEDDEDETATGKGRKRAAGATTTRSRKSATAQPQRAGAAQRVRANQRAFYQAFAAFERRRLVRRIGADERQRPEERYRLDEHDFSGVYEFTDLIDRFLPPAGLVAYDDLRGEED